MNKTIKKFYKKHKTIINIAIASGLVVTGYLIGDRLGFEAGMDNYQKELLICAREYGKIVHPEDDGKFVLEFIRKEAI